MTLYHKNSHITVRAYDTYEAEIGLTQASLKARTTEIDAILRIAFGDPIPASDAIGEAKRAGKVRCPRCNQYLEPSCYSSWTKPETGITYRKRYCNSCRHQMEKYKRYSTVEERSPYPKRLD